MIDTLQYLFLMGYDISMGTLFIPPSHCKKIAKTAETAETAENSFLSFC